ncbi:MAG TPA: hypothetical protein PLQ80_07830, partial [Candidatus Syntrophosphaera sp.]|nr:hypothetical protein [Candidatus Syntrophosphaera sp.]
QCFVQIRSEKTAFVSSLRLCEALCGVGASRDEGFRSLRSLHTLAIVLPPLRGSAWMLALASSEERALTTADISRPPCMIRVWDHLVTKPACSFPDDSHLGRLQLL